MGKEKRRTNKWFLMLLLMALFSTGYGASVAEAASDNNDIDLECISETFDIPEAFLATLDDETLQLLFEDVACELMSEEDYYVKVSVDEEGTMTMTVCPYIQYLRETSSRATLSDSSSGWMRFHITLSSVDSTIGLATCAYYWLTIPTARLTDCIGIALRQGTLINDTTYGFYSHACTIETYSHNFSSSEINQNGCGATAKFNVRTCDYVSGVSDYAFISMKFYKESSSEGATATYAHMFATLSLTPTFSIDRTGVISWSISIGITTSITQESAYLSVSWG